MGIKTELLPDDEVNRIRFRLYIDPENFVKLWNEHSFPGGSSVPDISQIMSALTNERWAVSLADAENWELDLERKFQEKEFPQYVIGAPLEGDSIIPLYDRFVELATSTRSPSRFIGLVPPNDQEFIKLQKQYTDDFLRFPLEGLPGALSALCEQMTASPHFIRPYSYVLIMDNPGSLPVLDKFLAQVGFESVYVSDADDASDLFRDTPPLATLVSTKNKSGGTFRLRSAEAIAKIQHLTPNSATRRIPLILYGGSENNWDRMSIVRSQFEGPCMYRPTHLRDWEALLAEEIGTILDSPSYDALEFIKDQRDALLESRKVSLSDLDARLDTYINSQDEKLRIVALGYGVQKIKDTTNQAFRLYLTNLASLMNNHDPEVAHLAANMLTYSVSRLPRQALKDLRDHMDYGIDDLPLALDKGRDRDDEDRLFQQFSTWVEGNTSDLQRPSAHRTPTYRAEVSQRTAFFKFGGRNVLDIYRKNMVRAIRFNRRKNKMVSQTDQESPDPIIAQVAGMRFCTFDHNIPALQDQGMLVEIENAETECLYPKLIETSNLRQREALFDAGLRHSAFMVGNGPLNEAFYSYKGSFGDYLTQRRAEIQGIFTAFFEHHNEEFDANELVQFLDIYQELNDELIKDVEKHPEWNPLVHCSDRYPANLGVDPRTIIKSFDLGCVRKFPLVYELANFWQLRDFLDLGLGVKDSSYSDVIQNVKGIRFVSDYNLAALTSFNPLSAAYSNGMMRFVTEEMQWDLDDLIAREKAGSYEQSPAVDSNRLFMDNVSAMESFSKRHEYPTKGELQSEKRYFSGMDKRRHHTVIGLFDERITHHLDAKNYRMVIYLDDLRDCIDGHNETKELLPHFMESGHDPSGEFSKGVIKHIMPNFFNALRLKDLTSTATFLDYILRNRIGNYVIPTEEMNMISGTVLEQMDIIGGSAMAYARTRDNSSLLHKCEKFSKIAEGYKQRFEKIFNRYQAT